MDKVITHHDIHVYLTMDGTYRAYIKGFNHSYCDAWGSFRSSAIRKLIDNLIAKDVPFDFSDAPSQWFDRKR